MPVKARRQRLDPRPLQVAGGLGDALRLAEQIPQPAPGGLVVAAPVGVDRDLGGHRHGVDLAPRRVAELDREPQHRGGRERVGAHTGDGELQLGCGYGQLVHVASSRSAVKNDAIASPRPTPPLIPSHLSLTSPTRA